MTHTTRLDADGFHLAGYHSARPFSSFLPGIAGEYGKPMWVFYTNRGQCISSFGVGDKNGAMLEFQPANKAYVLSSLLGFRTFIRLQGAGGVTLYEPFQPGAAAGVQQRLTIHPEEIVIEETNPALGLRVRVAYFTLPGENLPALLRCVTVENIGSTLIEADVLDGLPQIVPFGLEEKLLKLMSRTMEAFAEVRHVDESLPYFKLKVEPSDKPDPEWIDGGFFAFTLRQGKAVPVIVDPELVFGADSGLRTPEAFITDAAIDMHAARRDTLTGCAFARLALVLAPGASSGWDSYYGQVADWAVARDLRNRAVGDASYAGRKREQNRELITRLSAQFALLAGPEQLDAYTRQAFLDNTLRGGQPVVTKGPRGPRVFHTFTRKHGDMERDYNFFELAPTYWSQGNGNFRDVNQNRRNEHFIFPAIDTSNIETFFDLIQLDGNNPLVIQSEKFCMPPDQFSALWAAWPAGDAEAWRGFLSRPFSPGQLLDQLLLSGGTPESTRPVFDQIIGLSDKIQDAAHGEGYWVDHWFYNLDLIDSYAALFPDRMRTLLFDRRDFSYYDNAHTVQPRDQKMVLRKDGTVRQLHAVVADAGKARMISRRTEQPNRMRAGSGHGVIFRTTLLAKILNLVAVKASLFDPFGIGLEMEAEKPGWCDALNGLPGLLGSSTHEAFALRRWVAFVRRATTDHLRAGEAVRLPAEVSGLLHSLTTLLASAKLANFLPVWQRLADRREAFREQIRLGVTGDEVSFSSADIQSFCDAVDRVLNHGLARAVDATGLPVSYYTHEVAEYDVLPAVPAAAGDDDKPDVVHVAARRFVQKPIAAFLEGTVHALRSAAAPADALVLYGAVRQSALYDRKLGMYRVNVPLDAESFEIGRSRIFSPGWLENESVFLHMHYKFMLETLRSGLAPQFFEDMKRGLVAFQDPAVYGRSPLENSSFIASSRFPDAKVHGTGFVARLSGATAEWISMVLHMGLGAAPFRMVDGALRFEPKPVLADWLFTSEPKDDFEADSYGFKLFGTTWVVYRNPKRGNTYGDGAVAPVSFALRYADGRVLNHAGGWLPARMAADLREGRLDRLLIQLDQPDPCQ